jgi:sodium-dependent dicarboxylate transporter 2/3/5
VWATEGVLHHFDSSTTTTVAAVGLVLTVLAYVLTLVFGATYWHWLGYV